MSYYSSQSYIPTKARVSDIHLITTEWTSTSSMNTKQSTLDVISRTSGRDPKRRRLEHIN